MANGVTPTQPNPELSRAVAAAAAGGRTVVLACEAGGTLQPSVSFAQGKVSRSLKAAWKVGYWVRWVFGGWRGGSHVGCSRASRKPTPPAPPFTPPPPSGGEQRRGAPPAGGSHGRGGVWVVARGPAHHWRL